MWSMPDKVLRVVAGLLAACALSGLVLGVAGAPTRGRLPGEAAPGSTGAPMAAAEAQPLNSEELAPPKPPEPIAQKLDEDDDKADAAIPPPVTVTPAVKPAAAEPAPAADPVGALIEAPPAPKSEDPPF